MQNLTRRQQEIYDYLAENAGRFDHPPSYDELCEALGLNSRGSLHKHIQALVRAGLVEPMEGNRRGIRLVEQERVEDGIPFLGRIAAGRPIEAVTQAEYLQVPAELLGKGSCYVLQVSGDSMIEEGILDGDYVVIEHCDCARNGEIVVALIEGGEVTLKRIEQHPGKVILHPANAAMEPMVYPPEAVRIQGVLRGLLRSYR
jgi:repressor LexA